MKMPGPRWSANPGRSNAMRDYNEPADDDKAAVNARTPLAIFDSAAEVFALRAWARAHLWQAGVFDVHEAVAVLWAFAEEIGLTAEIGKTAVGEIIAAEFKPVVAS